MRKLLTKGSIIKQNNRSYIIDDIVGTGSSCVVYNGHMALNRTPLKIRIKECYPDSPAVSRKPDNSLAFSEKDTRKRMLEAFEASYNNQLNFQNENNLTNVTVRIEESLCNYNNTLYQITAYENGTSFDKAKLSLYDSFRAIKALCKVLDIYHNAGYLHLDVKPSNFMVIPETPELVKLFDFDSFVKMSCLTSSSVNISYSKEWAAPEVRLNMTGKISPASDVYSVGALVYSLIFNTLPDFNTTLSYGNYDFSTSEILSISNPALKPALADFFTNTMAPSVNKRTHNMTNTIAMLDNLINLANPDNLYIADTLPVICNYFCGRNEELSRLSDILANNKIAIISGITGVGKSELAKQYTLKYKNNYAGTIFLHNNNSLLDMLLSNQLHFSSTVDFKNIDECINTLSLTLTPKHLMVLDNITDFDDSILLRLLSLPCKFLITTKLTNSQYEGGTFLKLTGLPKSDLTNIFYNYYNGRLNSSEVKLLDEILENIEDFTILMPLIAKQMEAGDLSISDIAPIFNNGLFNDFDETIRYTKDQTTKNASLSEHLISLFNLSPLDNDAKKVLFILSLLSPGQINRKFLKELCGLKNMNTINTLTSKGWIEYDEENRLISVHDIIAQIFRKQLYNDETISEILGKATDISSHIFSDYADYLTFSEDISNLTLLNNYNNAYMLYILIRNLPVSEKFTETILHIAANICIVAPQLAESIINMPCVTNYYETDLFLAGYINYVVDGTLAYKYKNKTDLSNVYLHLILANAYCEKFLKNPPSIYRAGDVIQATLIVTSEILDNSDYAKDDMLRAKLYNAAAIIVLNLAGRLDAEYICHDSFCELIDYIFTLIKYLTDNHHIKAVKIQSLLMNYINDSKSELAARKCSHVSMGMMSMYHIEAVMNDAKIKPADKFYYALYLTDNSSPHTKDAYLLYEYFMECGNKGIFSNYYDNFMKLTLLNLFVESSLYNKNDKVFKYLEDYKTVVESYGKCDLEFIELLSSFTFIPNHFISNPKALECYKLILDITLGIIEKYTLKDLYSLDAAIQEALALFIQDCGYLTTIAKDADFSTKVKHLNSLTGIVFQ